MSFFTTNFFVFFSPDDWSTLCGLIDIHMLLALYDRGFTTHLDVLRHAISKLQNVEVERGELLARYFNVSLLFFRVFLFLYYFCVICRLFCVLIRIFHVLVRNFVF